MSLRRTPANIIRNLAKERNEIVDKLSTLKDSCQKKIEYLEGKLINAPNEKTRISAEKDLLKERERCVRELERLAIKIEKMSGNIETRTSKLTLASTRKNTKIMNKSLNSNAVLANALAFAAANVMTKTRKARRSPEQIAANKALENAERAAKVAARAEEKAAKEAAIAEEKAKKAALIADVKATKEAKLAEAKALKEAKIAEVKAIKESEAAAKAIEKVEKAAEKAVKYYPQYTKFISNSLKETGTKMKGHNVIRFVANFKKSHPNTYNTFKASRTFNKSRIYSHLLNKNTRKSKSYNPFNNNENNKNKKPFNPFNNNEEEISFNLSNNNNSKNKKPYNPFNDF
jgi:membrane protein involved in colicin uptake